MIVCYRYDGEDCTTVIECTSKDKDFAKEVLKDELTNFKEYVIRSAVLCEYVEKIM